MTPVPTSPLHTSSLHLHLHLHGVSGPPRMAPLLAAPAPTSAPSPSSRKKSASSPWIATGCWAAAVVSLVVMMLVATYNYNNNNNNNNNNNSNRFPSNTAKAMPFPKQTIRIFGPSATTSKVLLTSSRTHHQILSSEDRFWYMQTHGESCSPGMVERYDQATSSTAFKLELWKYCVLYQGHGNVYQDDGISWFVDSTTDILKPYQTTVLLNTNVASHGQNGAGHYHGSFLQLNTKKNKQIAHRMCHFLVDQTETKNVPSHELISSTLYKLMATISSKTEYRVQCHQQEDGAAGTTEGGANALRTKKTMSPACPLKGGYCCQVVGTASKKGEPTALAALKNPLAPSGPTANSHDTSGYISTVTVHPTHAAPATPMETPNFFDILLQNDCLPTSKNCYKCLKKPGSRCTTCAEDCGCYCKALCHMVPPPKVVTEVWKVSLPSYRRDPTRLIPRLVHQTWFEPVTSDKYPNMSRLIESWKTSGWEYTFYDDGTAADFLQNHFPPAVRQAYDTILPGAFKADLFRYCVLFIKGGIYADMDVLLESNLNAVVAPDIGFMVPIDEPGSNEKGHRSCLWNGLLAVTPGHVILAQTIELVVNNIRNRFTSVDYDNMLCPNPTLSVSHTVDTLFTCGPCILGAAMNQVLGRHMQSEWELGEVDIWKSGAAAQSSSSSSSGSRTGTSSSIHASDDPRHAILGRTVILAQNKQDMGAHRFTDATQNAIVASTDMPDYDDRPPTKQHYSRTHEKVGVYGLRNLYKDNIKANEEIRIEVLMENEQ